MREYFRVEFDGQVVGTRAKTLEEAQRIASAFHEQFKVPVHIVHVRECTVQSITKNGEWVG